MTLAFESPSLAGAPALGAQPNAMVDGAVGARANLGQAHDRIHFPSGGGDGPLPVPKPPTEELREAKRPPDPEITLGQKMLSAVAGSFFTSVLVTPLDVVRVRLQSQSSPPSFSEIRMNNNTPFPRSFSNLPPNLGVTACCREVFWVNNNAPYCVVADGTITEVSAAAAASAANAECAVEETQRKTFTSTLDGLRKIARNEGLTTLWRGLSPTLVMAVPGNVIYFAGYDWLRTSKSSPMHNRVSDIYSPLVAGSTARVVAAFFVSPIELFRTRMQASQSGTSGVVVSHFRETASSIAEMVRNQGFHTLWRGLSLTLWRDVPFSALYWWGYEFTRNTITDVREGRGRSATNPSSGMGATMSTQERTDSRTRQNRTSTLVDSFASGAISGGFAAVVTTPFDVGKTRQQVFKYSGDSEPSLAATMEPGKPISKPPQELSMPRFLWHIFKEEGVPGLFRGCAARVLKVAPACAIMISSYELGKKMASGIRERDDV